MTQGPTFSYLSRIHVAEIHPFKTVNDPVHGYIPITEIEYKVMQTPAMIRLHDLKQLSMAYLVFPGANGTRFAHSLGVMDQATALIRRLLGSCEQGWLGELFPKNTSSASLIEVVRTVRMAALLHDVGHGPYSHATEELMRAFVEREAPSEAAEARRRFQVSEMSELPIHEYYSCKIAESAIQQSLQEGPRPNDASEQVLMRNVTSLLTKDKKPKQELCTENGLGILRKVISSQLDADRMDYLKRDAFLTAVPYGNVDVDRVVMNLQIRRDRTRQYQVAIHERGLAAVEDMLDARYKMYKWLYSHHMVVALDELLRQTLIWLVGTRKLSLTQFGWKVFGKGQMSDGDVHTRIKADVHSNKSPFYGMIDRRYAPVSLFKRPEDHKAFLLQVAELSGKDLPYQAFREKLQKFISRLEVNPVIKVNGREVTMFATRMARSPYLPVKSKDTIWVCSDRSSQLADLTAKSDYFAAINREWAESPSYYMSYVTPAMPRDQSSTLKKRIRALIAGEIAKDLT